MSIWKLDVPLMSEPLMEFGQSHRIMFVHRKRPSTKVSLVQRKSSVYSKHGMEWNIGAAYFLNAKIIKCKEFDGLGWICNDDKNLSSEGSESGNNTMTSKADNGPRETTSFVIVKVLPEKLCLSQEKDDDRNNWSTTVTQVFLNLLNESAKRKDRNVGDAADEISPMLLGAEDVDSLRDVTDHLLCEKGMS